MTEYTLFGSWWGNYFKSINTGDISRLSRQKISLQKANVTKLNGKHFHPKNEWHGCPSWLQFKLLIDLIFESVHSERRLLPLRLLAKRSNSICHFHCLAGKPPFIFSTVQLFSVYEVFISSQSSTVKSCHAHVQVAHDMYPILIVYQRIIEPDDTNFALTDRQWSFPSILVKNAWFYCKRLQNDGALNFVQFFSGPPCRLLQWYENRRIQFASGMKTKNCKYIPHTRSTPR